MKIFSLDISEITISELTDKLTSDRRISVAVCNINTLVSVDRDKKLENILNHFTFRVPDGMPLVWLMRKRGLSSQQRLNGMKVLKETIEAGLKKKTKHFFLGTTSSILSELEKELLTLYPDINITGLLAPPFGTQKEIEEFVDENISEVINSDILWIGLGMPKQELLMQYLEKYELNTIGVGAVFEWIAGTKKNAPELLQTYGLEWLHRLLTEPKRLWKRYLFDFLYIIKMILRKLVNFNE